MELRFRILNVFTHARGRLTGNPLCVFENGTGLDDTTMQALARQFNLSETTFILPSERADARVRIFTPSYEMPFAGHPTLGTAHVCRSLGRGGDSLTLEMRAGVIPVDAVGDRWTLRAGSPSWREIDESREELAEALGIDAGDIGERPLWVDTGREQLVVPLTSEQAVRQATPRAEAVSRLSSQDGQGMAYLFAMTGPGRALARFFFPNAAVLLEDPATGSATANLGGWHIAMDRHLPVAIEISQGEFIGRRSTLYLGVDEGRQIFVSGDVVALGDGTVAL
jgi:trans-2,3-dihydro-3-hydroxyanthranilate isomerase